MSTSLRATLRDNAPGLMIEVPEDVIEALKAGKRPAVKVTLDGSYEFRTRVMVYGGRYYLGLRKDQREAAALAPGQEVDLQIELDEQPREVSIPEDFANMLAADPEAQARFDSLSFTNRKEYVQWVASAKKAETRERRLADAPGLLKSGKKTPS